MTSNLTLQVAENAASHARRCSKRCVAENIDTQLAHILQVLIRFRGLRDISAAEEHKLMSDGALAQRFDRSGGAKRRVRVHVSLSGVAVFCIL
jgi:hypothetical protein